MTATLSRSAFAVRSAEPVEHAAAPALRFAIGIESERDVRSILLDTQIRIAPRRRRYDAAAEERLFGLFGPAEAWGTSLQSLLWTRQTSVVPPFRGATRLDLVVPCSYDLEVAASAYLAALDDGDVPLEFQFSGSLFYAGAGGLLQTERLSWDHEAEFRLPVAVWREAMDRHFPGAAWLRVGRETFDRLAAFRARTALTWDEAFDVLLEGRG